MGYSSSGRGHRFLRAKIAGSNPAYPMGADTTKLLWPSQFFRTGSLHPLFCKKRHREPRKAISLRTSRGVGACHRRARVVTQMRWVWVIPNGLIRSSRSCYLLRPTKVAGGGLGRPLLFDESRSPYRADLLGS